MLERLNSKATGHIFKQFGRSIKTNSPVILAVVGAAGVVVTAVLASKASFEAAKDLEEADPQPETTMEKAKIIWPRYIPAGVSGTVTVVSIIGSNRIGNKKTAAAMTAYSLAERAFGEYREKVAEQFGERKEQNVRDEIAKDVIKNYPPSKEVIIAGSGHVLCCELMTRRYFMSDMETLRRAQNDVNMNVVNSLYATLSEFYHLVGLSQTSHSDEIGWDSDKLMVLEFSTILTEDGKPCLAFNYNYTKPI